MSQQYSQPTRPAPERHQSELIATVSTPEEEKETNFGNIDTEHGVNIATGRLGVEPADKVVGVEKTCVDRDEAEARKAMEEHERLYTYNRDTLLSAIGDTNGIVSQLADFNRDRWIIHYPELNASEKENERPHLVRSASVPAHKKMVDTVNNMSVLRLDLKVGAATTPSGLVHSLEKSAVAQLLEGRLTSSLRQLENLRHRVSDKQSKVFVTGDLNAGKSTFVNALLRRNVMPIDQQPCTTVFCEVLDAELSNEGKEEIHVVRQGSAYDITDHDTYTVHKLEEVEDIMAQAEEHGVDDAPVIKCYCLDTRTTQESLLRNGVVDISLIDAPGLNRDSLKTTALFARQDEIDVIVFCVSAENHFTLSAKEFLLNASNDKAHVFIVVNKYDQIHNKDRCRARVLEQIRHLSPRTYEDAENLVHFVDSRTMAEDNLLSSKDTTNAVPSAHHDMSMSFANLEAALCDFVLTKRNKSKLLPAQTYLLNLLLDIDFLARTNLAVADREMNEARDALAVARPALKKVQADARKLEGQLENEEDGVVGGIVDHAKARLNGALDKVATGQLASEDVVMPPYPGLLSVWEFAYDVRQAMLQSIERAVCVVEDLARDRTTEAVGRIRAMGTEKLPDDVEKPVFVARPEAMFAKRRAARSTAAAGLGLGAEVVEVRLSDIFDAHHHLMVITGSTDEDDAKKDHDEEMSLVNSLSLGIGALTLVGGKAFGAKSAVEALVRVSDLIGNPAVRRWALPVFLVASTGMVAWTIVDLPNSIPRNVGRSLSKNLKQMGSTEHNANATKESTTTTPALIYTFSEIQSRRVGRETRKVIRLAGYDVNERFRIAIASRKQHVAQQEEKERKASSASTYFTDTRGQVKNVRTTLDGLTGWDH